MGLSHSYLSSPAEWSAMNDLRIDASIRSIVDDPAKNAQRAEDLGFDGVWTSETAHDSFLPHPLMAEHTSDLQMGTRIALAFTRSPMVLAYKAWDLARYSDGRFVLGLGTQVKGHNERRFSVDFEWESPGPRLREVVESIQHIFEVFQSEEQKPLDYHGEFFDFSLMTETFDPGPIDNPDVPIYIAGVNEYNIQLAGELCDGLCMHSFNTPKYTEEVIAPLVAEGAERGDRSLDDVALSASPFVITGETEEERQAQKQEVKERIAFYGSTRTYHDVLELHGWKDVGMELHELSKDGKWQEMGELITEDMLDAFAIRADPEDLLDETRDIYGDVADRVVLPLDHGAAYMD